MYDLSLDQSTIFLWLAMVVPLALLGIAALSGLIATLLYPCRWWLRGSMALLVLGALLGVSHTTVSPHWYHRIRLEPNIARGEEVFRRYAQYRAEYGRYPSSPAQIDLLEWDAFDHIIGWRVTTTGCSAGQRNCTGLLIETREGIAADGTVQYSAPAHPGDGALRVVVFDGLFRCEITNLQRDWHCRDMR